jgi:hypothetical protein
MRKNDPTLPFGPSLLRAYINDFHLPRTLFAFCGNWLIPKRKISRVIRCLNAGDSGTIQARLLYLTVPLAVRDKKGGKVFLYAIGLGRANASLGTCDDQSAAPIGKRIFLSSTGTHRVSSRQNQKPQNSSSRSSLQREGVKGTSASSLYVFFRPETWPLVAFTFRAV